LLNKTASVKLTKKLYLVTST